MKKKKVREAEATIVQDVDEARHDLHVGPATRTGARPIEAIALGDELGLISSQSARLARRAVAPGISLSTALRVLHGLH